MPLDSMRAPCRNRSAGNSQECRPALRHRVETLLRVCEQQAGELPQYVTPLRPRNVCPFILCLTRGGYCGRYVLGRCDPDFTKLRAHSLLDYVNRAKTRLPPAIVPLHTSVGVSTVLVVSFKSLVKVAVVTSMLLCCRFTSGMKLSNPGEKVILLLVNTLTWWQHVFAFKQLSDFAR
jgi:hypothetical protein